MLTTAREMDCQFIWNTHAAMGRQSGLSDDLVESLRDRKELGSLSLEESAVINYGCEFFRTHKVVYDTFNAAMSHFGTRGLVELATLMGYYACLPFNINTFEVGLPEGITEETLPVSGSLCEVLLPDPYPTAGTLNCEASTA